MHNLRTISFEAVSVDGDVPLTATAWDTTNDSLICAFGPTATKSVIELKRKTKLEEPIDRDGNFTTSSFELITSWDAPSPLPELDHDEILLLHHFADTATICLVLAGGDLVLVREEPEDGQERIEIVGSVDVGIAAAAWAPDVELLAIVTNSDSLVLMSRDLEPVTETTMSAEDLSASKHVSVGWGKKETQFQGKRAKAIRDPTMPEQIDEGVPSEFEDGRASISWRGDGSYFAVNAVVKGHRRVIRVYTREGLLDSASEPVDGLESALSWRPSGNLLASVRRSRFAGKPKLEVIFFERNGLRHGEFPLRINSADVDTIATQVTLAWNLESTVLAVSIGGYVQYWTMGNYHYYLKQEVKVSKDTELSRTRATWHPEKALKCCVNTPQSLVDLEYLLHVNRGSTGHPNDYGIVAVIDGKILKLTPLKHAGVPPPMAFCEEEAQSNIIDVAVSGSGQSLAVLVSTGIELWQWKMRNGPNAGGGKNELRHSADIMKRHIPWHEVGSSMSDAVRHTQVVFYGSDDIFVLAPAQRNIKAQCFHIHLCGMGDGASSEQDIRKASKRLEVLSTAMNLLTSNSGDAVWVQSSTDLVPIKSKEEPSVVSTASLVGLVPNTVFFEVKKNPDAETTNGVHQLFHKVSLNRKGILLVDGTTIARDCTSYVLTDLHLIYTTAQHLLKFVYLSNPESMKAPEDTPEVDERCRSIERGARIITVIPSIYAVVLQMPRGNLETIYPRVLVLNGIRLSLRNLQYRTAFVACQNHQVDPNILHDYQPEIFMANVTKFIEDLKKPVRVDEFLSKLKEEDVSQTLYRDTLNASTESTAGTIGTGSKVPSKAFNGSEKINTICDAFIAVLEQKPGKFLQCIITAHVCKRPADLASALTLVSSLRQTSADDADRAVSHLCFLTDTNRLYDAALALYDLELTLLVAQNAQRDPREYMPFLQNLQSLPPLRRRFQIDNYLHNYEKAMDSLHALEAHEEIEAYTIKYALYTHALDLYKYSPPQLTKLTSLYAEHLASQSQHSAAAILYESLTLYSQAYPLYALAHQWRESLTCATLTPLDPPSLRTLALTLATNLADESRDYRSAATIHTDYLSDPLTAAKLLCKGSYFASATLLLSRHNLTSSIPTTIDTGLTDKFSEILELVSSCTSQLTAQVPRIIELRAKKAEDPLAFYGGDATAAAADGIDIPDNISLAPTDATTAGGQSLFTRYGGSQGSKFAGTVASNMSRATSKTRRKEERKRARGKKGSVYEEEYLVASVGRLIERVNGVHAEVGRLVEGLMRRGMRERALKVGEVMRGVVAACEKARAEVWDVSVQEGEGMLNGKGNAVGEEGWRPSGADAVFLDSQIGVEKKEVPAVKGWKGMEWL